MRVLIVARCKKGCFAPFITEQVLALQGVGIDCCFFPIKERGFWGYLQNLSSLRRTISTFKPDLIHAHYGLCGLFANIQRKVPVVTTYHGSDINNPRIRPLSRLSILLSAYNIFVSKKTLHIISPQKKYALIPCGVNLDDYPEMDQKEARARMNLKKAGVYVLFAGAFDNSVKNAALAMKAISRLNGVKLIELKGYSRAEVAALMYSANALLMTSITEGSPQVIKEALACGCPIVSVDVGDVNELTMNVEGCYIAEKTPESIAGFLQSAINFGKRTDGRHVIVKKQLSNDLIANRIVAVYQRVVEKG